MPLLVVSGFSVTPFYNSFAFNHLFLLKSRTRQKEENTCYLCLYREIAWKAVKASLFKLGMVAFIGNECETTDEAEKFTVDFFLTLVCPVHCGFVFVYGHADAYAFIRI